MGLRKWIAKNLLGQEDAPVAKRYGAETLSGSDVQQQYGTGNYGFQSSNAPGQATTGGMYGSQAALQRYEQPAFSYAPIKVPAGLTQQEKDAFIQAAAAKQERQAALMRNQNRAAFGLQDIERQIADQRAFSDTYGSSQRENIERNRVGQASAERQNFARRGLTNATLNTQRGVNADALYQGRMLNDSLAGQAYGREAALRGERRALVMGVQDNPLSFGEVASYGREPGQIQAFNFSADRARIDSQNQQRFDNAMAFAKLPADYISAIRGGGSGGGNTSGYARASAPPAQYQPAPQYQPFNPGYGYVPPEPAGFSNVYGRR